LTNKLKLKRQLGLNIHRIGSKDQMKNYWTSVIQWKTLHLKREKQCKISQ